MLAAVGPRRPAGGAPPGLQEDVLSAAGRTDGATGWRRPPDAAERQALARDLGAGAGRCANCHHLRLLRSGRSVFVRCWLAESDRAYPRYPALPVLACDGYRSWDPGEG